MTVAWRRIALGIAISVATALVFPGPSQAAGAPKPASAASTPDYSAWAEILQKHYDPARGMDYAGLKASDAAKLGRLRAVMSLVDVTELSRNEQLAFWINLYNISVVGIVVDHYPVDSIRDISTDPIIRLNVFKKDLINFNGRLISLDHIEHEMIRNVFRDPRIHFAINCAARSCPPIRPEPFVGSKVDAQLDDQARSFLSGPHGARVESEGNTATIHTTKIMDWFKDDFESWGGGSVAFLKKYLPPAQVATIDRASKVRIEYDDYSWDLNEWKR